MLFRSRRIGPRRGRRVRGRVRRPRPGVAACIASRATGTGRRGPGLRRVGTHRGCRTWIGARRRIGPRPCRRTCVRARCASLSRGGRDVEGHAGIGIVARLDVHHAGFWLLPGIRGARRSGSRCRTGTGSRVLRRTGPCVMRGTGPRALRRSGSSRRRSGRGGSNEFRARVAARTVGVGCCGERQGDGGGDEGRQYRMSDIHKSFRL